MNIHRNIYKRFRKWGYKNFYRTMLEFEFYRCLGYRLNLNYPQTFNEKLQWLKVYYRDPIMTSCADKVAVRDIVAEKIGKQYLIPIYGIYDNVDEIDLAKLTDSFVLKPNHSSGRVVICNHKSKEDWKKNFALLRGWMKENYYYQNGEWVYKDIKPKIICEKMLEGEIVDYKFLCFYGEPKLMFTCTERDTLLKVTFFDLDFNKLPFIRKYPSADNVKKPEKFEEMIDLSKKLAKDFPFVRVDFYENIGRVYFGELTFFPGNGMEWFEPVGWDKKIGDMLNLMNLKKHINK